jgi:hypothetical protein
MNVFAVPSTCGEQRVPSEPLPNPPERAHERVESKLDGVLRQQAERERDHAQSGWL